LDPLEAQLQIELSLFVAAVPKELRQVLPLLAVVVNNANANDPLLRGF
jgi:hypothetical protein